MNYLVVVAHPDDEVLGAGATIHKLIAEGEKVAVAILVGKAGARANISATLSDDEAEAMRIMGVEKVYHADFPNIKLNTVPHLDLVQFKGREQLIKRIDRHKRTAEIGISLEGQEKRVTVGWRFMRNRYR